MKQKPRNQPKHIFKAKAPCRIDLSGGTLDIRPLYLFYPEGISLNHMAIELFAETEISKNAKGPFVLNVHSEDLKVSRSFKSIKALKKSLQQNTKDNPLRWILRVCSWCLDEWGVEGGEWNVVCRSQVPPGSGLGGSSTLGVSLLAAWAKALEKSSFIKADPWKYQSILRDLESVEIEKPAGEQDYVPALFGGLLTLKLSVGHKGVLKFPTSKATQIASQLGLLYTGKPHHSGINNWSVFKQYLEKNNKILTAMGGIHQISEKITAELFKKNSIKWKKLVGEEWLHRQNLGSAVNAPVLKQASRWAVAKGAVATKACGAGGGGCLLVVFKNQKQKEQVMSQTLPNKNWEWLPVICAEEGVLGSDI